jgi:multiple antibiotic resistance protein
MSSPEFAKVFVGMMAIVNPMGAVPIFMSLTAGRTAANQRNTAIVSTFSSAIVMVIALFAGVQILGAFGIGIPAFRVAGGILIFSMSLSMLHAKPSNASHTAEEHEEAKQKDSVAVVPLAIPLLAGPGTMSTVIVYGHSYTTFTDHLLIAAACVSVCVVVLACFLLAPRINRMMGRTGMNLLSRIMGLLLMAISIEFVTRGLLAIFPGWNAATGG